MCLWVPVCLSLSGEDFLSRFLSFSTAQRWVASLQPPLHSCRKKEAASIGCTCSKVFQWERRRAWCSTFVALSWLQGGAGLTGKREKSLLSPSRVSRCWRSKNRESVASSRRVVVFLVSGVSCPQRYKSPPSTGWPALICC